VLTNNPMYFLIAGEALLLSLGVNGFLLFRSRRLARQRAADAGAERRAALLRAMEDEIRKVEAEAEKAGQVQTPQGERDRRLASAKLTSLRGALAVWKKAGGDAGEVWRMRDKVISHLDSVKFQWKKSMEQLEDRNTLLQQKQNDFQNQLVRSNADTVVWLSRERFDALNGERQRLEIQHKLMTQRLEQETARAEILESKQQTLKKEYMKLYQTFATFRASRGVSAAKAP
jgi:hypothetical protein